MSRATISKGGQIRCLPPCGGVGGHARSSSRTWAGHCWSGRSRPTRSGRPSARWREARYPLRSSGGWRAKRTRSAGTERSRCPGAGRRPRRRTGQGRRRAVAARSGRPSDHHGGQPGRGYRCARAGAWQPAWRRARTTRLADGLGARGAGGGPPSRAAGRRVAGALLPSAASATIAGRLHRPRRGLGDLRRPRDLRPPAGGHGPGVGRARARPPGCAGPAAVSHSAARSDGEATVDGVSRCPPAPDTHRLDEASARRREGPASGCLR